MRLREFATRLNELALGGGLPAEPVASGRSDEAMWTVRTQANEYLVKFSFDPEPQEDEYNDYDEYERDYYNAGMNTAFFARDKNGQWTMDITNVGEKELTQIIATVARLLAEFLKQHKHLTHIVISGKDRRRDQIYQRLIQQNLQKYFPGQEFAIDQGGIRRVIKEFAPSPDRNDNDDVPDPIFVLANRWWNARDSGNIPRPGVAEDEGDAEGLPHLTQELLTHIVDQVGTEGAHAIIKSLEWGDGAATELLALILRDLKQDITDHDIEECLNSMRPQGVAEGSLEANTPNPVVVIQDLKGKILDKVNLLVAVQKYKLGNPQDIKNQLAHQNSTTIGNYVVVSPMTGQPQDATTRGVAEDWSKKYKSSINCSHPRGFSQKAHCASKKKHTESVETEMVCEACGMCQTHGNVMEIKKGAKDSNGFTKCWSGYHADGTQKGKNGPVRKCVKNENVAESANYWTRLQAERNTKIAGLMTELKASTK